MIERQTQLDNLVEDGAIVLYDFRAQDPLDISLTEGERLTIIDRNDPSGGSPDLELCMR